MDDVRIGKEMFQKAIDFMDYRYGINKSGGVAVLRIETGEYLISIWDEESYVAKSFNVGMTFGVALHNDNE